MGSRLLKMLTLFLTVAATVVTVLIAMQWKADLREIPRLPDAQADAKQAKPTIGAIGYVHKSEGKEGAKGEGEKGAASASSSGDGIDLVTLDEMYVNAVGGTTPHSVGMKLDLELFNGDDRPLLEERLAAVKDTIINATRAQDYVRLSTLGGKLYFKEYLVSQLNQYFHEPIVRDVQFVSFYMQ